MALTYEAIATVTVGSGGAATIDFQNIPGTYTDLILKFSGRDSGTAAVFYTNFNNNTSSVYSWRALYGTGTAAASESASSQQQISVSNPANINWSSNTANTFSNFEMYIPNYAGSNNKSVSIDLVTENNATDANQVLQAALWANTAAITRITLDIPGANTFVQHSTATLYGIKNTV